MPRSTAEVDLAFRHMYRNTLPEDPVAAARAWRRRFATHRSDRVVIFHIRTLTRAETPRADLFRSVFRHTRSHRAFILGGASEELPDDHGADGAATDVPFEAVECEVVAPY